MTASTRETLKALGAVILLLILVVTAFPVLAVLELKVIDVLWGWVFGGR